MEKIDNLDKKILSVLDEDARLSESAIGKKVRASKQVVKYRLNRFQKKKIIENYYTMLDLGKLGFDSHYVFIQLTGLNAKQENERYKKILKLPYVAWLVTGVGRWEAVIVFCSRNIAEFNKQLEELKNLFGFHLHEHTFTTLIQAEHLSYKFLRKSFDKSLKTTSSGKEYSLDKIDKKILNAINQNGRIPVTEISEMISAPPHKVHYRLKQLKKTKMIQGFRPKINIHKLGMQWHLLLIQFNSVPEERIDKFMEYCKNNKNVYYATNTVGKYNLMLDIHVKDTEEFRNFLFDIKNSYEDVIFLYESLVVFEEQILTYIPKIILE